MSVSLLSRLTNLDLSHNQITRIPREVNRLNNLQKLIVSHNHLEQVPNEMGELRSLKVLDFCSNPLRLLPVAIFDLPSDCNVHVAQTSISGDDVGLIESIIPDEQRDHLPNILFVPPPE